MSSPAESVADDLRVEPESVPAAVGGFPDPSEAPPLAPAPRPAPRAPEPAAGVEEDSDGGALGHPLVQDLLLDPARWRIWPAVAILRWVQRRIRRDGNRIVYRSHPSLSFAGSEIHDVAIHAGHLELVLNAAGLATAGSALPSSDIARIIADARSGGALNTWLDGLCDLFMQVLETMQAECNAPFALMTGGRVEAHMLAADIVGHSAPLAAGPNGALYDSRWREPEGAVGLAGMFVGPISASGLAGVFSAFTGLAVRIEEFTGAEVVTARPARVGLRIGMMLGSRCRLPSAGVEVHIQGGSAPSAQKWARESRRRRSLRLLALSYVGAPVPAVRLFLWLDAGNAPPAALSSDAAFGGLAVLGTADRPVTLPIEI